MTLGPVPGHLLARAYDLQHDSRAADRSSDQSQDSISTQLKKGIKVPVVIPLLFRDNHPSFIIVIGALENYPETLPHP